MKSKKNIKKNIKKNNSVKQIKKIFNHLKNGLQKFGGNNCTTQNNVMDTMKTCIPNVNVEQYKCPCNYLPLDGSKQNVYPLSHNPLNKPPYAYNKGGKKSKKKVKGGEYLSVDNHTNAYFRLGAKGNCCGPHWKYTNISGGRRSRNHE